MPTCYCGDIEWGEVCTDALIVHNKGVHNPGMCEANEHAMVVELTTIYIGGHHVARVEFHGPLIDGDDFEVEVIAVDPDAIANVLADEAMSHLEEKRD